MSGAKKDPILSVRNVAKNFEELWALDGADMDVEEGSMALLIGPNGSGKTTLINVVTGVYAPIRGRVIFDGQDITLWPPHKIYKRGLARTWQIPQPFLTLSVLENLLVAEKNNPGEGIISGLLRRRWEKFEEKSIEKAFRLLKMLKLDHLWDSEALVLSGGQIKLLEAGRALMSGARMILMDEPAAGVNPVLAHEVFEHLRSLNGQTGLTFLLVEHRLEIAMKYVDQVFAMHLGKVIAQGKPEIVLNDAQVIESYLGR